MYYTIYKITNIKNGMYYIGQHRTLDLNDKYMGSGKHLKRAISKHGIENFKKEYLFIFDNEFDMESKERELVTLEFCSLKETYNLCPGGNSGGFVYANINGLNQPKTLEGKKIKAEKCRNATIAYRNSASLETNEKYNSNLKKGDNKGNKSFSGKKHSEETKIKISKNSRLKQSGNQNSQFGSMWITNGTENKKIKKDVDIIPEGWYKGRCILKNIRH